MWPRALLLALVLPLLDACERRDPPRRLLAVVVDLSGPGREEGMQVRDGARLALREATRAREAVPELTLLVQDDRGDPARARRLAEVLVEIPEVLAVVISGAPETARPALDAYAAGGGLPVLVAGVCSPELTEARPWVFCLAPGPEYLGETLAWFLVTELGLQRAAAFFSADPYGQAFDRGFEAELRRLGGEVVQRVPFDTSVASFELYLAAARAAPAVLVAGTAAETRRAVEALRAGGVAGPVLAGSAGAWAPSDSAALYRPALFDPALHLPGREFVARFVAAFSRVPGAPAALAYDAASLVARATAQGIVERAGLVEWLGRVGDRSPHEGVTGRLFFGRERQAVREVGVGAAGGVAASRALPAPAAPGR